jgi:hypothetical protein
VRYNKLSEEESLRYERERKRASQMTPIKRTVGGLLEVLIHGYGEAVFTHVMPLKEGEKVEEAFTDFLRTVNDNVVGKSYKAKDPIKDVQFLYTPCMDRQRRYAKGFPQVDHVLSKSWLIDAFAVIGGKYNLRELQVFVEIHYSEMSDGIV